jgi:ABC-type transporter Mla subunit MlaD
MILFVIPVEVSIFVIICIAATGCVTALYSWIRISNERKRLKKSEIILISDDAWEGAFPHDIENLRIWFRNKGIKEDSYLGHFIRTCWSTWVGGKPASLTELHNLVVRRERNHKATRLSAGIAGLLLVLGIIGTLSAVKPVLEKFQIQVAEQSVGPSQNQTENAADDQNTNDSRDAASVAKNADKVNSLIKNLGGAFSPSLWALIGTIFVVTCRGFYSQALYNFTLELDRFALNALIPRYRTVPISEQFEDIKKSMSRLAETITQRDSNFENVVEKLDNLVNNISPSLMGLDGAAKSCMESVEALTKGSASIADALNQHLGARSSIHRAIKGLDKTYSDVESWFKELATISETINQSNTASKKQINDAIKAIAGFLNTSVKDFEADREKMVDAIDTLKKDLIDIPEQIKSASTGLTTQAIKSAENVSQDLQKKFYERNINFMDAVKTTITSEVRKFDKVSANISDQSTKIETSIRSLNDINKDLKKNMEEASFARVNYNKDITAKDSLEITQNNSSLPNTIETQKIENSWRDDGLTIHHENELRIRNENSTPEEIDNSFNDDEPFDNHNSNLTDTEYQQTEQIKNPITATHGGISIEASTIVLTELDAVQDTSAETVRNSGAIDENSDEEKPNNHQKSSDESTATQSSRRFWWPRAKK